MFLIVFWGAVCVGLVGWLPVVVVGGGGAATAAFLFSPYFIGHNV